MYKDFDALWERFCIMTVDGNIPDEQALKYLKNKTSKELYEKLMEKRNAEEKQKGTVSRI